MSEMEGRIVTVDIPEDVRQVLLKSTVDGNVLRLPPGQLPRDLYERVNKVLMALGGKWNRSQKGHVFPTDPSQAVMEAVSGVSQIVDVKKTVQYFPTPPDIARQVVWSARISPGMKVLEPSAGQGAIADAVLEACPDCILEVVEIEKGNRKVLKQKGYRLVGSDFLKFKRKGWDRIVMNPPFTGQQDVDHVMHAYRLLKPGGILVSVMSPGVKFRENKKMQAFRAIMAEAQGQIEDLPEEAFKESGTGVGTVMVTLEKPEA